MKLQRQSTRRGLGYAAALRAIGDDLASDFFQSLEIGVEDAVYIVRGVRTVKPGDGKSAKFERRYTADDVAHLDRLGRDRQTGAGKMPDPGTLREALRIAGGVVDAASGRFVKLVKEDRKIVFEFVDASGARRREELHGLTMHQSQQQAVAARTGDDIWTNSKG